MPADTKYRPLSYSEEGTGTSKKKALTTDQHPHKNTQEHLSNVIIHLSLPSVKSNILLILEVQYSYVKFNI